MSEPVTRNLVILLTDIKGFTDRTSNQSRAEMQNLLEKHKEIVLPVLQSKGGTLIKTMGDAFLMTYESPTNAVLAGIAVQAALERYNEGKPADQRIDVRVAINQGEVNLADHDVFGEAVNITARIEAVADAGDVFFTEAVYLSMNKKEVPSSEVGLLQLKGIPEKIRVYRVKRENPVPALEAHAAAAPAVSAARPAAAAPGASRLAAAGAAALLVSGAGFFLTRVRRSAAPAPAPAHTLTVQAADRKTFVQSVNVAEGRQGNFVGAMLTEDGGDSRRTVFNALVSPKADSPGVFDVTYRLDVAPEAADPASALKVQGELELRSGERVATVECGPWTVALALDGDASNGAQPQTPLAGLDDFAVTAALSKGAETTRCREVLKLGSQGNVAQGAREGKGRALIFNSLPGRSAQDGAVDLEYQLEYRARADADLLQVQNQQTLALGRGSRSELSGYRFDLLAENAGARAAGN
jgi:class 3 adenylate cyclase